MKQEGRYDFETLSSEITIKSGDHFFRYIFELEPDRSLAHVTRQKFNPAGDQVIEQLETDFKQAQLETDAAFPAVILWWARGLWGLPLEYQGAGPGRDPDRPGPEGESQHEPDPAPARLGDREELEELEELEEELERQPTPRPALAPVKPGKVAGFTPPPVKKPAKKAAKKATKKRW
jgi:hypothetical protein